MIFTLRKNIILFTCSLVISSSALAASFAERPEVKTFIQQMVTKHHFEQKSLTKLFQQFEPSKDIIQKISKPFEEAKWQHYRKLFITQERICLLYTSPSPRD